jgi:alanyl-tRNA synthetase
MKGKLYYTDPYIREFSSTVVERGIEDNGLHYVVLNDTAFYPTGGGQPCDQGTINGIPVLDVEEVDGQIRHRSSEPISGDTVIGILDWERRFDHMQQHTGQHILSASLEQLFDAVTVGFHLGRETVTIDLNITELTDDMIHRATQLSNQIVVENRSIKASFVDDKQLSEMPLRKSPTVKGNIRVVVVEGFDYSPCGGTHPYHTGEVGPIQILGTERNKNGVRVGFVCGLRSVRAFLDKQKILRRLTHLFSSSEEDLVPQVERFLTEKRELEKLIAEFKEQRLDIEAVEIINESALLCIAGNRIVMKNFSERSMQELQRLARKMTANHPEVIVLLVSDGPKLQMVCARGQSVQLEMDAWMKFLLPMVQGKGGGNKEMAQGGGVPLITVDSLLQKAMEWLHEVSSDSSNAPKQ